MYPRCIQKKISPCFHINWPQSCYVVLYNNNPLRYSAKSVWGVPGYWRVSTHVIWFNTSALQIRILPCSANMVPVMLQQNWMDYSRSHQSTYTIQGYEALTKQRREVVKSAREVLGLVVIEWDDLAQSGLWWFLIMSVSLIETSCYVIHLFEHDLKDLCVRFRGFLFRI